MAVDRGADPVLLVRVPEAYLDGSSILVACARRMIVIVDAFGAVQGISRRSVRHGGALQFKDDAADVVLSES